MAHLFSLFLFFRLLNASVTYKEITVDLRGDIEYYLQQIGDPFTVGNLVRFGFHSCVTGCDGCFNVNNPPSAGTEPSFSALIKLFTDPKLPSNITWSDKIENFADFWTISTTVSNLIAIPDGEYAPDFKFWAGRKACATSPNQTITADFPSPLLGLDAQTEFFGTVFNLTQKQYIALIGGHTLGFAHSTASGYDTLPWTATPTILDNEFYFDIINKQWYDTSAQVNHLYEWEGKDNFFMFNSDICVYKNLSQFIDTTTGQSHCDYPSCPVRSSTEKQINDYANNGTLWLNDYSVAWNRMMLAKCDINALTPILP